MTDSHLIKLVWYVVHQYAESLNRIGVDQESAFSRGLVGLAYAVRKYDSTQGKFGSFAFQCIKREIFSFPTRHDYWSYYYRKVFAIRDLVYQRTGRRLANFELAKLVGVTEEFIDRGNCNFVSLERCNFDTKDGDSTRQKEPADQKEPAPWEDPLEENKFVVETVQNILNDRDILDDIERKVIKFYFGLPPLKSRYQQKQIAMLLDIYPGEVRRIIDRVLEKLSSNKQLQELYTEA